MEQQIKEVTEKLINNTITKDEADKILLGLLNVINRREMLIDFQYHRLETKDNLVRFELIADKYLKSINSL